MKRVAGAIGNHLPFVSARHVVVLLNPVHVVLLVFASPSKQKQRLYIQPCNAYSRRTYLRVLGPARNRRRKHRAGTRDPPPHVINPLDPLGRRPRDELYTRQETSASTIIDGRPRTCSHAYLGRELTMT